jgi:hypothetical protein
MQHLNSNCIPPIMQKTYNLGDKKVNLNSIQWKADYQITILSVLHNQET